MAPVAIHNDIVAKAHTPPPRALGLGASMALVIGNMIGSGIFLLPASLAALGGISIVGWAVYGAGAQTVLLGFLLLLLGIPAYVWMRKQQADEEKKQITTNTEHTVVSQK